MPLPYLNLATEGAYIGEPLVVAGQAARGGRGIIGSVTEFGGDPITSAAGIKTRAFTFSYTTAAGSADDAYAEGGDSGSPSFALRSGEAALVGTHSAVLSVAGSITTYDTLVPHYVPELNSRMEASGLHMRKINPPATSFSATGAPTTPGLRTAKPFVLRITLGNGSAAADNLTANLTLPAGFTPTEISAPGWFATGSSSIRRGGLAANESVQVDVSLISTVPGPAEVTLDLKSDGSAPQSFSFSLNILPSFANWAAGLQDMTPAGDSDGDGISNLLEYASGGDNRVSSRFFPGTSESLLPVLSENATALFFFRRTDATDRGLHYHIERSETLGFDSWQSLEDTPISVLSSPASGFERVSASLPATAAAQAFYRMRIELAE